MNDKRDTKLRIVFNTERNSLREFEGIFYDLKMLENVHNWFIADRFNIKLENSHYQSRYGIENEVYYISKKSPFDIGLLVQQYWREFIVIAGSIASYPRLKSGSKELLNDADYILTVIESKLAEVFSEFPQFEREMILDFVRWYLSKTEYQRKYIKGSYRQLKRALYKITSIFIDQ